jgi:23S rRNA U2552 (ribose-2'-O)-methylase RlmE/FtsJ
MIYFVIPKTINTIYKNIEYIDCDIPVLPFISNSLSNYLYEMKNKINENEHEWNIYKKYTNSYEYINTSVPHKKKSISKYKPLSRSFFKMVEIINFFNINANFSNKPINSFHLCEGPGGFIEALIYLRKKTNNCNGDLYYGMTILDDEQNDVPAWKKSFIFLKNNKNLIIENGIDNTGNILSIQNFLYCNEKYASSMDFITADGGFDFSSDFNNQETSVNKLLFAQIVYALCMQKENGFFILKIFDCFMQYTIDLLNILSSFYETVYITKPYTSRFANSEKYIVCSKFLFNSNETFFPYLYNTLERLLMSNKNPFRFLNIPTPIFFISKIEEYNSFFGMSQIENISNTILLIENNKKNEKIEFLIKNNIMKCVNWCIKNDISYNIFQNDNT